MSAWIVSKGHIDVLVNGLVQYGLIRPDQMNATGQMLWLENHRSINARYGDRTKTPTYSAKTTEAEVIALHLVSAIHCYDYQSCEHGAWEGCQSEVLMRKLEQAIENVRPGIQRQWQEGTQRVDYRWGYDNLEQALVVGVGEGVA